MRRAAAALLAAGLLWPATAAGATQVDATTLADLAGRAAAGDAAARAELLDVDTVDGRPVDVAALLAGAGGDEAARLAVLAEPAGADGTTADTAAARRRAEAILAEARFGGEDLEARPTLVDRIFGLIDDFAAWILPAAAGDNPGWVLAGLVVVTAGVVLAVRAVRRRSPTGARARRGPAPAKAADDPDDVAAAADAAAAAGDYAGAVRLRFRAGLLYLDRRRMLAFDPAMTTGRLARTLPGRAVREVADAFDAIVYGGRPASVADADAARRGWSEILEAPG